MKDRSFLRVDDCLHDLTNDAGLVFRCGVAEESARAETPNIIHITRVTTPIGAMFAAATALGVCLLEFTDRPILEAELADLRKRLNAVMVTRSNYPIERLRSELAEYFSGERKTFSVPLDAPGSDFQRRAWDALQGIPHGQTRTYKQQAVAVGNPKAIRAVASANARNRISILIPCHRVIASDGGLAGYGGGLHRKRWLLDFES